MHESFTQSLEEINSRTYSDRELVELLNSSEVTAGMKKAEDVVQRHCDQLAQEGNYLYPAMDAITPNGVRAQVIQYSSVEKPGMQHASELNSANYDARLMEWRKQAQYCVYVYSADMVTDPDYIEKLQPWKVLKSAISHNEREIGIAVEAPQQQSKDHAYGQIVLEPYSYQPGYVQFVGDALQWDMKNYDEAKLGARRRAVLDYRLKHLEEHRSRSDSSAMHYEYTVGNVPGSIDTGRYKNRIENAARLREKIQGIGKTVLRMPDVADMHDLVLDPEKAENMAYAEHPYRVKAESAWLLKSRHLKAAEDASEMAAHNYERQEYQKGIVI